MGKNYVIINDIDSRSFPSLLIEELPVMQIPKRKVEVIDVDGRSGSLTITDDCYENTQKTIRCKIYGNENVDNISLWLYKCNRIIFSNRPDRYYNAMLIDQIDFERSMATNRSFEATFNCEPFGYLTSNNTITITRSGSTFNGMGNYYSEPIITVYGSGTINLTINETQITLKDVSGYITVNCQKKRTHKDTTLLNIKKVGDFPTLKHNTNTISWSGTVTKVEIVPNWRYLV